MANSVTNMTYIPCVGNCGREGNNPKPCGHNFCDKCIQSVKSCNQCPQKVESSDFSYGGMRMMHSTNGRNEYSNDAILGRMRKHIQSEKENK